MSERKQVTIFTDGACKGNPGPGGWAAVLLYQQLRKELSGGVRRTTNNRMELTALVQALEILKEPCEVDVHTDSQYLQHAFTKGWLANWKRNGWRTKDKQPVQNRDLWEKLDKLRELHTARFHWVRGHGSSPENNRCDLLAVQASNRSNLPADEVYEQAGKGKEARESAGLLFGQG